MGHVKASIMLCESAIDPIVEDHVLSLTQFCVVAITHLISIQQVVVDPTHHQFGNPKIQSTPIPSSYLLSSSSLSNALQYVHLGIIWNLELLHQHDNI